MIDDCFNHSTFFEVVIDPLLQPYRHRPGPLLCHGVTPAVAKSSSAMERSRKRWDFPLEFWGKNQEKTDDCHADMGGSIIMGPNSWMVFVRENPI